MAKKEKLDNGEGYKSAIHLITAVTGLKMQIDKPSAA